MMPNVRRIMKESCPYVILILLTAVLCFRARYGFCWSDESFYLSGVNRILRGDRFLTDEWNVGQVYSIILFPVAVVYKLLFRSWDGVYLNFRIISVLFQFCVCVLFYKVMVKHQINRIAGLLCSIIILFYSRAYINTLSYYTVILILYILVMLLFFDSSEKDVLKLFFAGIFLGGVMIINPYFVIVVFTFVLGTYIYGKRKNIAWKAYLLPLLLGLSVCGGFSCYLVFRNNSISEIMASMTWWTEGDSHKLGVGNWWKAFYNVAARLKYTIIPSGLCVMYSLIQLIKKNMTKKKSATIFVISFILFMVNCLLDRHPDGNLETNLAVFGLQVFIISQEKRWDIFRFFYLPGLILAFFMNLSSNTGLSAMSIGFALSGGVSCIFIWNYVRELLDNRRNAALAFCGLLSLVVAVMLSGFYRVFIVYRDSDLKDLSIRIEEGPAKGLLTSADHYEQYMLVLAVMNRYCDREGNVLILSLCPWAYLCTDMRCGAYTTWEIKMDSSEEKLRAYYEQHSDRIPDVVIELDDSIGGYDLTKDPQYDLERHNSFLWQYMEDSYYEKIEVPCGYVWIKQ